jgi:ATP-dependent Clp protease protease subunit
MEFLRELVNNNIIILPTDIKDSTVQKTISELLYISSQNTDDIKIFIKSNGGDVDGGFAIINTMRLIKNNCITICVGETSSMGTYILAAGTRGKRFSLPLCRLMIHQICAGAEGNIPMMELQLRETQIYNDMLLRDFSKNIGKSLSFVKSVTKEDNWLSAQEAVEMGIVDKIVKRISEIR